MGYEKFVLLVDSQLEIIAGVSLSELPDVVDLADLHEDGFTPHEAAMEILEENGWVV